MIEVAYYLLVLVAGSVGIGFITGQAYRKSVTKELEQIVKDLAIELKESQEEKEDGTV